LSCDSDLLSSTDETLFQSSCNVPLAQCCDLFSIAFSFLAEASLCTLFLLYFLSFSTIRAERSDSRRLRIIRRYVFPCPPRYAFSRSEFHLSFYDQPVLNWETHPLFFSCMSTLGLLLMIFFVSQVLIGLFFFSPFIGLAATPLLSFKLFFRIGPVFRSYIDLYPPFSPSLSFCRLTTGWSLYGQIVSPLLSKRVMGLFVFLPGIARRLSQGHQAKFSPSLIFSVIGK